MVAFFNAKLTSGIDVMLDGTGFDSLLKDAAFVVTGEGKLDNQTLDGKAISGLTRHAKKFGVPVIAICGQIAMGFDLEKSGLALATATSPENTPLLPSRNYKQEQRTASCSRNYYVGDIDEDNVKAKYDNGVLTVYVPKKEDKPEKSRTITIE